MGLFSRKKQTELPRLPRLPDIPDLDFDSNHDLPTYEEQIKDQPMARSKPIELPRLDEPKRPMFPRLNETRYNSSPRVEDVRSVSMMDDKPIFVKIEKYKEALRTIKDIKERVNDAEGILRKIHGIRRTEEAELLHWEKELSDIKTKMLKIDKGLFEV